MKIAEIKKELCDFAGIVFPGVKITASIASVEGGEMCIRIVHDDLPDLNFGEWVAIIRLEDRIVNTRTKEVRLELRSNSDLKREYISMKVSLYSSYGQQAAQWAVASTEEADGSIRVSATIINKDEELKAKASDSE